MKAQQLALASIERSLKAAGLRHLAGTTFCSSSNVPAEMAFDRSSSRGPCCWHSTNVSRLVDRIERAGYVERRTCEEDGRGQLITITKKGAAIRRQMWPVYARAIEATIGRHVSQKDADALDELLGRLIQKNMEE